MIRTELFKLRAHRTPWVLLAILVASLSVAPIYFVFKKPSDTAAVIEAYLGVAGIMAPLLGAVFGGWVMGHEFRQGTLRRVLGNDARRGRLVATKAAVGLVASAIGMTLAVGIGAGASAASVASFGGTLDWDGVVRNVLSGGFFAIVVTAVAFGLSMLLRSDTYGMLGALGLMIIVGPLLTLIPTIGKYTPSALANDVTTWIAGPGELGVKIVPASLGLAASLAALAVIAMTAFQRRDI
jgi:ABC-type transport system involved in multi-copper enzyme maturation permease subunit